MHKHFPISSDYKVCLDNTFGVLVRYGFAVFLPSHCCGYMKTDHDNLCWLTCVLSRHPVWCVMRVDARPSRVQSPAKEPRLETLL